MGWSSSKTSGGGGGGGTTINPTDNRVPVRQDASTFADAQIISKISSTPIQLELIDSNDLISVDWENRLLNDSNNTTSVDWGNRELYDSNFDLALSYFGNTYQTTSNLFQNNFDVGSAILEDIVRDCNDTGRMWYSGHTVYAQFNSGIGSGELVSLSGNIWSRAIADALSPNATNMIGIKIDDEKVFLDGHIVVVNTGLAPSFPVVNNISTLSLGQPIYCNPITAGTMTINQPSTTNEIIKRLGHCYFESSNILLFGYFLMLFRPSNDWTVVP
jgi:hypothetical protein